MRSMSVLQNMNTVFVKSESVHILDLCVPTAIMLIKLSQKSVVNESEFSLNQDYFIRIIRNLISHPINTMIILIISLRLMALRKL